MLGTIARAYVAELADVAGDHPLGQADPSRVRMDVMVGTDARQPRVLAAASIRSARDDATDGAELHPGLVGHSEARLTLVTLNCRAFDIATSVSEVVAAVYSPTVLRLRGQDSSSDRPILRSPTCTATVRSAGGRSQVPSARRSSSRIADVVEVALGPLRLEGDGIAGCGPCWRGRFRSTEPRRDCAYPIHRAAGRQRRSRSMQSCPPDPKCPPLAGPDGRSARAGAPNPAASGRARRDR